MVIKGKIINKKGLHNGTIRHLIATNIAARGLDLPNIDLIV